MMDNENNREQTQETQNSTDRQDWLSEELKIPLPGKGLLTLPKVNVTRVTFVKVFIGME